MAADRREFAGLLIALPFGIDWIGPISPPLDLPHAETITPERWIRFGAGQLLQRKSGPNYKRPSFYPGD